jgi:hypothetical protein
MPPIVDEPAPRRHRRPEPQRKPWFRRPLPLAFSGLVVVVAAGVLITWAVAANSWYIAASDGRATLFHGLSSKPLGISLSRVSERGLEVSRLIPADQTSVKAGIDASSHKQGKCTLDRLTYNALADAWTKQQKAQASQRASQHAAQSPTPEPSKSAEDVHTSAHLTPLSSSDLAATQRPKAPTSAGATPSPSTSPQPTAAVPSPKPLPAFCKQ